jgi:hypothetical protein
MRRAVAIFILCGVVFCGGCDDKDAQQYAKELIGVLNSYQAEVNKKVKAEKKSYQNLAEIYEKARQTDRLEALEQERFERSRKIAVEMISGEYEPRPTEFLSRLRDYGTFDFELHSQLFAAESDARSRYLSDIAALEFDAKNSAELANALGELAKAKGRLQQVKEFAAFAKEVKDELDKLP